MVFKQGCARKSFTLKINRDPPLERNTFASETSETQSVRPGFPNLFPAEFKVSHSSEICINSSCHPLVLQHLQKPSLKCFAGTVLVLNIYTVFKCSCSSGLKWSFPNQFATQLSSGLFIFKLSLQAKNSS